MGVFLEWATALWGGHAYTQPDSALVCSTGPRAGAAALESLATRPI